MERAISEKLEIRKVYAEVLEFRYPWTDFTVIHMLPDCLAFIDTPQGVPYGRLSCNGNIELPIQDFITLLNAKKVKRSEESACIAKRGNAAYVYWPRRQYLAKFIDGELEFDIPDVSEYYEGLFCRRC